MLLYNTYTYSDCKKIENGQVVSINSTQLV